MPARRRHVVASLVGVCSLAAVACSSTASTERPLAELLAGHQDHAGTVIDYDAIGTEVLDCMMPYRSFRVSVDLRSGLLEVVGGESGERILVNSDAVCVLGALTTPAPEGASWWRIGDPDQDQLSRVLGADLAGAALAVPADGNDLVDDAIASGASIARTGDASFELTVATMADRQDGVRLHVEVDDDGHVREATVVSTSEPESSGFRMRFEPMRNPPEITVPDSQDVRDSDLVALASAPIDDSALGDPGARLP